MLISFRSLAFDFFDTIQGDSAVGADVVCVKPRAIRFAIDLAVFGLQRNYRLVVELGQVKRFTLVSGFCSRSCSIDVAVFRITRVSVVGDKFRAHGKHVISQAISPR